MVAEAVKSKICISSSCSDGKPQKNLVDSIGKTVFNHDLLAVRITLLYILLMVHKGGVIIVVPEASTNRVVPIL